MLITIGIIMLFTLDFFLSRYIRGRAVLSCFSFLAVFSILVSHSSGFPFCPSFSSCLHIFPESLPFLVAFCFCLVSPFAEITLATACGSPLRCFLYCLFSWIDTLLKNLGSGFCGEGRSLGYMRFFTKFGWLLLIPQPELLGSKLGAMKTLDRSG